MAEVQPKSGSSGWWIVLGIIGLVALVGMCSSDDKTTQSFASQSLGDQIQAMPSPTATAIAALDVPSVRQAKRHLDAVIDAEGLSGAMIYSQNCYDALSRAFSWAKLDQCGGFDLLAVMTVDTTPVEGLDTEAEYFGSEAAAGRYLALAIKGGEEPGKADLRFSELQREARKLAPPAAVETSAPDQSTLPDGATYPGEEVSPEVEAIEETA
jgi:hypothetical protein